MANKQTAAYQNSAEDANTASQLIDAKIATLAAIVGCNAFGIAPPKPGQRGAPPTLQTDNFNV